jgi:uncharacterized protein YdiU (UPF0061 family)
VVATGEQVFRATSVPGAVLARVDCQVMFAWERFSSLLRAVIWMLCTSCWTTSSRVTTTTRAMRPFLPLDVLKAVVLRQAALIADWIRVGFIHGVMHTDNMAISGETIDYGPCAFMDHYHPNTVFSSIDRVGRYSYANQSAIAQWNSHDSPRRCYH